MSSYLADPGVQANVEAALDRRRKRRGVAGARYSELNHVVHVKHNQRAVYIGDETDVTNKGNSIMDFGKSWKSPPIRSWSGGRKMADMPGKTPNRMVQVMG